MTDEQQKLVIDLLLKYNTRISQELSLIDGLLAKHQPPIEPAMQKLRNLIEEVHGNERKFDKDIELLLKDF